MHSFSGYKKMTPRSFKSMLFYRQYSTILYKMFSLPDSLEALLYFFLPLISWYVLFFPTVAVVLVFFNAILITLLLFQHNLNVNSFVKFKLQLLLFL